MRIFFGSWFGSINRSRSACCQVFPLCEMLLDLTADSGACSGDFPLCISITFVCMLSVVWYCKIHIPRHIIWLELVFNYSITWLFNIVHCTNYNGHIVFKMSKFSKENKYVNKTFSGVKDRFDSLRGKRGTV